MFKSSQKGANFERRICTELSLWFSGGTRVDLFWRNAGSGARNTIKAKQGVSITNSAGDVGYLCVEGKPLIDCITFELKAGYNKADTTSLIDMAPNRKNILLQQFITQAINSSKRAGTPYWAVIHHRNSRETLIHLPLEFIQEVHIINTNIEKKVQKNVFIMNECNSIIPHQITVYKLKTGEIISVYSMPFSTFCKHVPVSFFHSKQEQIK
jgi:hypothetical protein